MPPTASTIPADKTGSTHWRSSSFVSRLAQMIQSYLLQVGIQVEINSLDAAQLMAIRLDGTKYDLAKTSSVYVDGEIQYVADKDAKTFTADPKKAYKG